MSLRAVAMLALVALLTACGKAGAPVVPGSAFPLAYPDPKLAPTAPVRAAPEDQPGLLASPGKKVFTDQGSYIDPAVRETELQRGAVQPGSTLPYAQTRSSDGSATPFNQSIGGPITAPIQSTLPDSNPTSEPDPR